MQLGDNIKKYRKLSNKSQQDVADEIEENRSTYAEWEAGIEPKTTILIKIAKALGVTLADLLEGVIEGEIGEIVQTKEDKPGYIKTDKYLSMLETQNEFLRRNFETSLSSIIEGQQQSGIQIKALSWFSALAANSGDEKKAEEAMLRIGNKIAAYEGVSVEAGNRQKGDSKHTSVQRKRR